MLLSVGTAEDRVSEKKRGDREAYHEGREGFRGWKDEEPCLEAINKRHPEVVSPYEHPPISLGDDVKGGGDVNLKPKVIKDISRDQQQVEEHWDPNRSILLDLLEGNLFFFLESE